MIYNTLKHHCILAAASVMLLAGCAKWTEPQGLDYRRAFIEEQDKDAYEAYLGNLRQYKSGEHNLMFVTMKGPHNAPTSQNLHIMAMPDSADFICVKVQEQLHESVAAEIPQVRERKGTKVLLFVDYEPIDAAWKLLEDERADKGQAPGTEDEMKAYFKEQTAKQLALCKKYGFDGLMVSFLGNTSGSYAKESHIAYMNEIKALSESDPNLILAFRGTVRNVLDLEFMKKFNYLTIVAGEEKKLSALIPRIFGSSIKKEKIVMELSVPSQDDPEQKGLSPAEGASWLLSEKDNKEFSILGLAVSNASDDYFNKAGVFKNIRDAINICNPSTDKE